MNSFQSQSLRKITCDLKRKEPRHQYHKTTIILSSVNITIIIFIITTIIIIIIIIMPHFSFKLVHTVSERILDLVDEQ